MLEFHQIANLFPMMEGEAFAEFKADIAAKDIDEQIILLAGQVLDGRNRYSAGVETGRIDPELSAEVLLKSDPRFVEWGPAVKGWRPDRTPLDWVISHNLRRRHLSDGQRAAVAAEIEGFTHGGKRGGQDASLQLDRKAASDLMGISPRSTATASKVKREGTPELFAKVKSGEVAPSVAVKLLTLTPEQQRDVLRTVPPKKLKTVAKQVVRTETERRLGERQQALPVELFNVVLADPAWRFEPYSRETGMDRAADNHYPTQDTSEIMTLPVGTLAAKDCVLFLWATAPMLCEALRTMRFWGFDYKTHIVWRKAEKYQAKPVLGTGYWFRNGHELLLVGTRGDIPAPAPGSQWPSIVDAPPLRHSQKPEWAYELIEAYYPTLPKIELNARIARPGWKRWGNEAPDDENLPATAAETADEKVDLLAEERQRGTAEVAPNTSAVLDINEVIRKGYARNAPLAELVKLTGLPSENAVKQRAKRMRLGDKERQRLAVSGPRRREVA